MASMHNILNPIALSELARNWIKEDSPNFDLQGICAGDEEVTAKIFCKSSGVLAGVPFVNAVFRELECTPNWFRMEGETLDTSHGKIEVAYISGKGQNVLLAERVILNVLARCSGIATKAKRVKEMVTKLGWNGALAGSRKTTPGFRMVEKYGLLIGGADPHRYDLSSMVMLKDNHVVICGSMENAIRKVKNVTGFATKIEVESQALQEAVEAANAGVDIIMLDNFTPRDLIEASTQIKITFPNIMLEASGGITEGNIDRYAISTVDIISMSSLVQFWCAQRIDEFIAAMFRQHRQRAPTKTSLA